MNLHSLLRLLLSWVVTQIKSNAQRFYEFLRAVANSVVVGALLAGYHAFAQRTLSATPVRMSRRPAISGVVALFLTLVVAGAMLMIGYFVIAMIQNAIPTSSLNTAENSNLTSLEGNVSSAFLLAGIALIAIGAGGVIYSLVSSFGFGGSKQ